jgi:hypothetical protein
VVQKEAAVPTKMTTLVMMHNQTNSSSSSPHYVQLVTHPEGQPPDPQQLQVVAEEPPWDRYVIYLNH